MFLWQVPRARAARERRRRRVELTAFFDVVPTFAHDEPFAPITRAEMHEFDEPWASVPRVLPPLNRGPGRLPMLPLRWRR